MSLWRGTTCEGELPATLTAEDAHHVPASSVRSQRANGPSHRTAERRRVAVVPCYTTMPRFLAAEEALAQIATASNGRGGAAAIPKVSGRTIRRGDGGP